MIESSKISVVIQGPIDWSIYNETGHGMTQSLCQSIRKLLPESEIIISTWHDQKVDALDFDIVVYSKDPGPQGTWPSFTPNNVNRQIVSTAAGIKSASREYCLKIRSDIILKGTQFLIEFEKLGNIPAGNKKIFSKPIITNNLSSRNTKEILKKLPGHPLPFHPSDHVSFGLTEDVKTLWDISLQSDNDSYFFIEKSQPSRFRLNELSKLTPEQFIFTSAISKKFPVGIKHFADSRHELIDVSEYYMRTHIVSIPDRIFSIDFPKYHTPHHFHFEWMRRNPDDFLLKKYASIPGEGKKRRKLPKPLRVAFTPFRKSWKYLKRVKRLFTD